MAQGFPEAEGCRVLVVEDDPPHQTTRILMTCQSKRAQDALNLIRQEKEEFHILITASNVSDMDGFTFVEQVRHLKPDLPIIILMSGDGDMNKIRKMEELGGCHIIWEPMRVHHGNNNNNNNNKAAAVIPEEGYSSTSNSNSNSTAVAVAAAAASSHKRKEKQVVEESALTVKKARLSWTTELHQKFVEAVNMTGLEKASAKKVRELMNVEWLSREQVSSHLQKYRDYVNKKGKKKEAAAADESQIGVVNSSNSLAPPHHNLLINQNCNIAPIPAPSFEREVPMQMPVPMPMQRGGERVGFGHYMSYNQPLMPLQHDTPTFIPPQNNWNWNRNWNGGAAAAAAGPSPQSHFQPHQYWPTVQPVSHNSTRDSSQLYSNNNNLQEYLLNTTSDDADTIEQELAAADKIFPDSDVKNFKDYI